MKIGKYINIIFIKIIYTEKRSRRTLQNKKAAHELTGRLLK